MDKSVGIAAAVVPANKRGMTCPKPKHAKRITPLAGFPFSAIQAKRTAITGVVQGEDASPNVNPAAIGKSGAGIFDISFELEKSEMIFLMGPTGSGKSTLLKTIYKELEINCRVMCIRVWC